MYKHGEESHIRNKVRIKTVENAVRRGVQAGSNPTKRNECGDVNMIKATGIYTGGMALVFPKGSLPPLPQALPSSSLLSTTTCHALLQAIYMC